MGTETTVSRAEHLAWSKERALAYLDAGDRQNAYLSMISDLRKHPATQSHAGITMGTMLLMGGHLQTDKQFRDFITGFN